MLIDHLQKTFSERCRRNPQYSLRSFARALDIDSSTLSALLRKKRPLTAKQAQKLIASLDIQDPALAQNLLLGTIGSVETSTAPEYNELAIEAAEMIISWEHSAILCLIELDNFKANMRNISRRLNIPLGVVIECLTRLEKLQLIEKLPNETYKLITKNLAVVPNVPSQSLKELHKQYIQMSMYSLDRDPRETRDVSGTTMSICAKKLPEASRMIQEFRRNLTSFLETGPKDSVYRLNVQLFPLTQENQT
jgi:transcriptional regulator with XRE-family HTH domain